MKIRRNKLVVAVITGTVTAGLCLEQAGWTMRVPPLARIDQTTRNGP